MFVTNPIGILGEETAVQVLKKQGFRILERNWRLSHLEVDIIASDSHTIVFAEVKARTSRFKRAEEYVDEKKKRHMTTAANAYIRLHHIVDKQPRFDIFGIIVDQEGKQVIECNHIPNAFLPAQRTITTGSHSSAWQWKKRK